MNFEFTTSGKYWIMIKPRYFVAVNIPRLRDVVRYCLWVEGQLKIGDFS